MALVVFDRTENPLAEKTVALGLVRTGFSTSPLEFSRISSGEAKPIEILEKPLCALLSFLNDIFLINLFFHPFPARRAEPDRAEGIASHPEARLRTAAILSRA